MVKLCSLAGGLPAGSGSVNFPLTDSIYCIIIVHNMSMNIQRITVSLPSYLYENLVRQMPAGQVSRFVAKAVEKELMKMEIEPIKEFIALREKLPKKNKAEIIEAIRKGRI